MIIENNDKFLSKYSLFELFKNEFKVRVGDYSNLMAFAEKFFCVLNILANLQLVRTSIDREKKILDCRSQKILFSELKNYTENKLAMDLLEILSFTSFHSLKKINEKDFKLKFKEEFVASMKKMQFDEEKVKKYFEVYYAICQLEINNLLDILNIGRYLVNYVDLQSTNNYNFDYLLISSFNSKLKYDITTGLKEKFNAKELNSLEFNRIYSLLLKFLSSKKSALTEQDIVNIQSLCENLFCHKIDYIIELFDKAVEISSNEDIINILKPSVNNKLEH